MGIHQLDLNPGKGANERTSLHRASAYAKGAGDLATALALDPALLELIRGHARTMFEVQRYDDCRAIILGLLALGDARPEDATMMITCAEAAGDFQAAAEWRAAEAESLVHVERHLAAGSKR